ncbi:MAG: DUF2798 domain-containing protein [Thaumarchaeota archaeon]|nr:DUF2798 domain-containing protein [Nitrososphaerota archaeon]
MAKLNKKYSQFLFVTIMVTMMVFSVSLFITLISVGLISNFIEIWTRAYVMGFAIALPTALVVVRIAGKIVTRITA